MNLATICILINIQAVIARNVNSRENTATATNEAANENKICHEESQWEELMRIPIQYVKDKLIEYGNVILQAENPLFISDDFKEAADFSKIFDGYKPDGHKDNKNRGVEAQEVDNVIARDLQDTKPDKTDSKPGEFNNNKRNFNTEDEVNNQDASDVSNGKLDDKREIKDEKVTIKHDQRNESVRPDSKFDNARRNHDSPLKIPEIDIFINKSEMKKPEKETFTNDNEKLSAETILQDTLQNIKKNVQDEINIRTVRQQLIDYLAGYVVKVANEEMTDSETNETLTLEDKLKNYYENNLEDEDLEDTTDENTKALSRQDLEANTTNEANKNIVHNTPNSEGIEEQIPFNTTDNMKHSNDSIEISPEHDSMKISPEIHENVTVVQQNDTNLALINETNEFVADSKNTVQNNDTVTDKSLKTELGLDQNESNDYENSFKIDKEDTKHTIENTLTLETNREPKNANLTVKETFNITDADDYNDYETTITDLQKENTNKVDNVDANSTVKQTSITDPDDYDTSTTDLQKEKINLTDNTDANSSINEISNTTEADYNEYDSPPSDNEQIEKINGTDSNIREPNTFSIRKLLTTYKNENRFPDNDFSLQNNHPAYFYLADEGDKKKDEVYNDDDDDLAVNQRGNSEIDDYSTKDDKQNKQVKDYNTPKQAYVTTRTQNGILKLILTLHVDVDS